METKLQEGSVDTGRKVAWGPVAAVAVTVGVFIAAQVAVGMLLGLLSPVLGWSTDQTNEWLKASVVAQFFTVLLMGVVTLWLLWTFLKSRRARLADLGLVRPKGRDFWYTLVGYGVYFAALLVITQIAIRVVPGLNLEQEQDIGFSRATSGLSLVPVFASLVLLPPLIEEILARGFLYTGLRQRLPVFVAAIITSILFAAAHLQIGSGNALLWVAALDTFTLSVILVYLREKTGSLWSPIGVHMLKNGLAFTFLFIL